MPRLRVEIIIHHRQIRSARAEFDLEVLPRIGEVIEIADNDGFWDETGLSAEVSQVYHSLYDGTFTITANVSDNFWFYDEDKGSEVLVSDATEVIGQLRLLGFSEIAAYHKGGRIHATPES